MLNQTGIYSEQRKTPSVTLAQRTRWVYSCSSALVALGGIHPSPQSRQILFVRWRGLKTREAPITGYSSKELYLRKARNANVPQSGFESLFDGFEVHLNLIVALLSSWLGPGATTTALRATRCEGKLSLLPWHDWEARCPFCPPQEAWNWQQWENSWLTCAEWWCWPSIRVIWFFRWWDLCRSMELRQIGKAQPELA